jgi:hypothetical protein
VIVGLAPTIACTGRKLVVLPDEVVPIRPPEREARSGSGFEIVAGWEKPYSKYFDYAAGILSWTDGHDVFVGSDFAHGVGLGIASPPERWTSDESGVYWTTDAGKLWTANPQQRPRAIWRFQGAALRVALGRTAAYVVIAPGGWKPVVAVQPHFEELWRVMKESGAAARLWSTTNRIGPVIVDGDVVFTPNSRDAIRRIDGSTNRHTVLSTGFGALVGVDDRYVYGADGHAAYRAPKTGGRGQVLAQMNEEYNGEIGTRFGQADAVFEGGQLFWMEWPGLQAAPVQGGEKVLLAAMSGSEFHVIPGGDSVYVQDHKHEMVYRVPRRAGPVPVEIQTGDASDEAVETFTSNAATLFWVAGRDIWKHDRKGTGAVVIAAAAEADSDLVADDSDVYFTRRDGTLWRVPVSGGTPVKLADLPRPAGPHMITTAILRTVALRGEDVFFTSFAGDAVARVKKSGGPLRILARGIPGPRALVVDGESIYVLGDDNKHLKGCRAKLLRLPISGGKATELASDLDCSGGIATTRRAVWLGSAHGQLVHIPKQGGKPVAFPTHGSSIDAFDELAAFAVSGDSVYVSAADRIIRFDEGKPPRVVASGLLDPASSMWIADRTMHFIDLHSSKGIPSSHLYALDLVD